MAKNPPGARKIREEAKALALWMTEDVPAVAMVNFNMILFYYVAESGLQTRRTGQTREQVSLLLERFGNGSELSHNAVSTQNCKARANTDHFQRA